jgi:hypothetical protein
VRQIIEAHFKEQVEVSQSSIDFIKKLCRIASKTVQAEKDELTGVEHKDAKPF